MSFSLYRFSVPIVVSQEKKLSRRISNFRYQTHFAPWNENNY
jgi:hypothetical protein